MHIPGPIWLLRTFPSLTTPCVKLPTNALQCLFLYFSFLAVTWQLNRWPCHWLTHWLTDSLTHWPTFCFLTLKSDPRDLWPLRHWWQFLMTIFDDIFWWQFSMTIVDDNFRWKLWKFLTFLTDFWKTFKIGRKLSDFPKKIRFSGKF